MVKDDNYNKLFRIRRKQNIPSMSIFCSSGASIEDYTNAYNDEMQVINVEPYHSSKLFHVYTHTWR